MINTFSLSMIPVYKYLGWLNLYEAFKYILDLPKICVQIHQLLRQKFSLYSFTVKNFTSAIPILLSAESFCWQLSVPKVYLYCHYLNFHHYVLVAGVVILLKNIFVLIRFIIIHKKQTRKVKMPWRIFWGSTLFIWSFITNRHGTAWKSIII